MAWYLIKHRDNFTSTSTFTHSCTVVHVWGMQHACRARSAAEVLVVKVRYYLEDQDIDVRILSCIACVN
jgi:hypothetical protein